MPSSRTASDATPMLTVTGMRAVGSPKLRRRKASTTRCASCSAPSHARVGGENGELLAARARDHVILTRAGPQELAHPGDDLITHEMPVGVVDLLEVIEINGQQGERRLCTRRTRQLAAVLLFKAAPV
jgi:hypothetical protein